MGQLGNYAPLHHEEICSGWSIFGYQNPVLLVNFRLSKPDIEREHDLTVDLIDSDGVRMANVVGKLKFPQLPAGHVRGNQIIYFNGLQFPKHGVYEFKVIINGEVRASVPIGLNKIELPPK